MLWGYGVWVGVALMRVPDNLIDIAWSDNLWAQVDFYLIYNFISWYKDRVLYDV